ncbi:MAG: two-component sensor histidine kinase [Actinomycetales bacterium]|nr:MAG: two-component sensor histidine kinase [Actinomycetales bacterium]
MVSSTADGDAPTRHTRLGDLLRAGLKRSWPSRLWRRSLRFRVVLVTVVLGVLMLGAVGNYLNAQIAVGLVDERIRLSTAEALQLTRSVQSNFDATDQTQSPQKLHTAAITIVQGVAGTERSRFVVLARLATTRNSVVVPPVRSGEVAEQHIPEELRTAVAQSAKTQHVQMAALDLVGSDEPVPSVIVGQQVTIPLAGGYGIYYIYPMEQERDSLVVVRRTLLYGGFLLTALIAVVAYAVTRLVVAPVRRAAEVAQRLASGKLTERMPRRGEDELASLATSFNAMADGLQQQIVKLEDLSRVQQRFVSDVSHELRTPLTTIRMAVDVIHDNRDEFDPVVARAAELLQEQLTRFEALLADLLEISRFDAGAAQLDLEPADLCATVAKVLDDMRPLAMAKGSLISVVPADQACEASFDARRVQRILRNLVVNAIEHGEGRPVELRMGGNEEAVAVSIRDHGVGLRPGEAELVFNRFWRADPARARAVGGTGLGLAIALEDARLHSGWLHAWGEPGIGSCFRLTLPRSPGIAIKTSPLPLTPGDNFVVNRPTPAATSEER